jgi:hypothetical protein
MLQNTNVNALLVSQWFKPTDMECALLIIHYGQQEVQLSPLYKGKGSTTTELVYRVGEGLLVPRVLLRATGYIIHKG